LFLAFLLAGCQPTNQCPDGQTKVNVQGNGDGYVCLDGTAPAATSGPAPAPPPSASAGSTTLPAGDADAGPPPPVPCATLEAAEVDERVVPKAGAAPTYIDAAPPDGTYDLVQATVYGAAPFPALRATISVVGAAVYFGGQATTGALEGNESFVLAWEPGSLTKICGTGPGTLSTALLPGDPASKRDGHLVWDGSARLLTLDVHPDAASYELVFAPR
jgi:hypothetical protein